MTDLAAPRRVSAAALLFDMDGTLVDSSAVVERLWRSFAHRHELAADEVLAAAHGRRTVETIARFIPPGVDIDTEIRRVLADELAADDGIVAVPGARELLLQVPDDRWALVTSAARRLARRRMMLAGLPLPQIVVSADDVATGKPNPEGYLAAAARLGREARATIVFEDTPAGVAAGRAAGARTVVVGAADGISRDELAGLDWVPDFRGVGVEVHARGLHLSFPSP